MCALMQLLNSSFYKTLSLGGAKTHSRSFLFCSKLFWIYDQLEMTAHAIVKAGNQKQFSSVVVKIPSTTPPADVLVAVILRLKC